MANKTIYPYGVGGETPSGIDIVDDLTTGGRDKALSAEQGKELAQYVFMGSGSFGDAYDKSRGSTINFPWLLVDTDEEGNTVKKMIWHAGNGKFIDAIGAEIDGKKNGVTIKVNADCDVLIGSATYQLSEGTNFFTFDDLNYDGTSVINTFSFRDSGTSTANLTYAEEIDFFGMTLSCGYSGLFKSEKSLKKVSRLRVVRQTSPNATYMTQLLADCPELVSVEISGSGLGGQAFTNAFANCPKLLNVDMSGFNPEASWASKSIQGFAKDCFAIETLDVSGFSTGGVAVFDDWLVKDTNKSDGNSVLKKFIIGNFSNAGATSVNHFMPKVRNCVLICKRSTPPVLKNCAFVDSTAQDQYSTTYDWLSYTETVNGNTVIGCKFSAIYVPSDAVTAYKTNTYVENGTVGVTGWSKYADIIYDIAEYDG